MDSQKLIALKAERHATDSVKALAGMCLQYLEWVSDGDDIVFDTASMNAGQRAMRVLEGVGLVAPVDVLGRCYRTTSSFDKVVNE